jgi:hypothetical protein
MVLNLAGALVLCVRAPSIHARAFAAAITPHHGTFTADTPTSTASLCVLSPLHVIRYALLSVRIFNVSSATMRFPLIIEACLPPGRADLAGAYFRRRTRILPAIWVNMHSRPPDGFGCIAVACRSLTTCFFSCLTKQGTFSQRRSCCIGRPSKYQRTCWCCSLCFRQDLWSLVTEGRRM